MGDEVHFGDEVQFLWYLTRISHFCQSTRTLSSSLQEAVAYSEAVASDESVGSDDLASTGPSSVYATWIQCRGSL